MDGLNVGDKEEKKRGQSSLQFFGLGIGGAELPATSWEKRGEAGSGKERDQKSYVLDTLSVRSPLET